MQGEFDHTFLEALQVLRQIRSVVLESGRIYWLNCKWICVKVLDSNTVQKSFTSINKDDGRQSMEF